MLFIAQEVPFQSFFHPTEIETFNGLLHQCGDFGIT